MGQLFKSCMIILIIINSSIAATGWRIISDQPTGESTMIPMQCSISPTQCMSHAQRKLQQTAPSSTFVGLHSLTGQPLLFKIV